MPALLLSGREAADALLATLKDKIATLNPKLVIVQVGDDPGSDSYIKQKIKSCQAVGMRSEHVHRPLSTTKEELLSLIDHLNRDDDVTGFIVQLPLPTHLQAFVPDIIRAIDPKKDVDGFGAYNLGKMFLSKDLEHASIRATTILHSSRKGVSGSRLHRRRRGYPVFRHPRRRSRPHGRFHRDAEHHATISAGGVRHRLASGLHDPWASRNSAA
jgi:5,10-methylene-tetrahydrofolate dehydrogenase/methenyl tetrahydrofolate cyclohydrolase